MQNKTTAISPEALARQHEAREPHLPNVVIVAAGVTVMLLFCLACSGILLAHFMEVRATQNVQPLGIVAAPNLQPLTRFPSPNLQIDDGRAQVVNLLARQTEKLNSYGWVDRSNGIVRIPIDRAMDLLAQRGLPARTNGASQTDECALQLLPARPEQP